MDKWKHIIVCCGWMSCMYAAQAQLAWSPERIATSPYISASWTGDYAGKQALYYVISAYDIQRDLVRHQLWVQPIPSLPVQSNPRQLLSFDGPQLENLSRLQPHEWIGTRGNQCYMLRTDSPALRPLTQIDSPYRHLLVSPKQDYLLFVHAEKVRDVEARDYYPQFGKTLARIYHDLPAFDANGWENGYAGHLLYARFDSMGNVGMPVDLMPYEQASVDTELVNGSLTQIHWSPDERYIVYAAYKPGGQGSETGVLPHTSTAGQTSQIYLYDLQNGLTSCLTCEPSKSDISHAALMANHSPLFNPAIHSSNSHWIAWIAETLTGSRAGQRDLVLADLEHRTQYNLTRHWAGRVNRFWWSNDGQSLLFTASYPDSAGIELYRVQVLDNERLHTPLVIQQVTHLHASIAALVGETPAAWIVAVARWHRLQKLFWVDKQNGSAHLLVQTDTTLQDANPFAGKVFSLAGGTKVRIQVYRPFGFDSAGETYPAIICLADLEWFDAPGISAGPSGAMSWEQPQMLADAGYWVFTVSPEIGMSGASGQIPNALAFYLNPATLQSLADSLSRLLAALRVDTQRLVLMGSGWGAYLALSWASNPSHSFSYPIQRLVLWNPVVNIPSWESTTSARWIASQIHDVLEHEKMRPVSDAEWRVPALPMLIGVGGKDGLVSSRQGLGLFNEAKDQQLPGRLLYFPDIAHHWQIGHELLVWQHQVLNWLANP